MRALNRKLLRDVAHLRGQLIAVALVVMCGVAMHVTMRGAYRSLVVSQQIYYRDFRFADIFAHLERAPLSVADSIRAIPGVVAVQPRIVFDVTLDVPRLPEPATGRLVSIPEQAHPALNDIYLRQGRWIEASNPDEIVASEAFCKANGLKPGDSVGAIINGRWRRLQIVGIGLSPEYVYEIRAGDVFPDARRFGVLWIGRKAIQNAFSMEGAFNDIALATARGVHSADVIAPVDQLLAEYGGTGAYDREQQLSNRFLSDEIKGDRVSGYIVPAIFLGVAAFLVHLVLTRLVQTQRDQIAVLKAFGYTSVKVGLHYLGIAFVSVAAGSVVGIAVGVRLALGLVNLYKDFYNFPVFRLQLDSALLLGGVVISAIAAGVGALLSVRAAVRLPPAEAMRPEAPPRFHAGLIEHSGLLTVVSPATRIVLRNLLRRRVKSALSILGIAMAVAILVVGRFMFEAIDYVMHVEFQVVQREDVSVPFLLARPGTAVDDLRRMDGVLRAEPFRAVSVRLEHENHERRTGLIGVDPGSVLHRLVGSGERPVAIPPEGIVMNQELAGLLHVEAGDTVVVHVLEATRPVLHLTVSRVVDELIGIGTYIDIRALRRALDEGDVVSGAYLSIDPLRRQGVYFALKQIPAIAGVSIRQAMIASFKDTIAKSLGITNVSMVVFACIIAAGIVYNGARIALSERGRELASLRVLGFTRGEVGGMLVTEQAILTLAAIPLGLAIGYGLAAWLVRAYQSDLYRIPLIVTSKTDAFAIIVVVLAAIGSNLLVLRRIRHLDLVEVLKARE